MTGAAGPLRIANCSGFYGDRLSAAREMVEGGPIDVLTGDWLAELTMLILAGNRLKGRPGYARTFLTQMEQVLGTCVDRGIKIVSNAGGLDPAGCALAVSELATRLGLAVRVAHVTGDDLIGRDLGHLPDLVTGEKPGTTPGKKQNATPGEKQGVIPGGKRNATSGGKPGTTTGEEPGGTALTANAYLGGEAIAVALANGADVVVTGRVTDAALVTGPGMWRYGWRPSDLDALAGSVVAGHIIECGCQATGGNYAFFTEVPDLAHCGFPIAELHADGSSVITKHPGTGGRVSVGTVTAQLLYEIGSPRYLGPDVTARFDTIELAQVGHDRVRVSGVRGEAPPDTLKVALNHLGGYRNTMTLVLTGLDIEAKARLAEEAIFARVPREAFDQVHVELTPLARPEPTQPTPAAGQESAEPTPLARPGPVEPTPPAGRESVELTPARPEVSVALLRITVMDADQRRAGRAFSSAVVETGLAGYPGFYGLTPPGDASAYGVFRPAAVPRAAVRAEVWEGAERIWLQPAPSAEASAPSGPDAEAPAPADPGVGAPAPSGPGVEAPADTPARPSPAGAGTTGRTGEGRPPVRHAPLGTVAGARSGDKGGDANLGVWVRTAEEYAWLEEFLTTDRLRSLLPGTAALEIERYRLPNLLALNFVVRGLLGRGVAASPRMDAQAKALGEELRACVVPIPF
ncbi:acyclic terpene utilization AtuA family protein [Sphaerisporangium sp. NPDC088356]|uniref:acyclic terpene utilization AtuA family protein n=1 Tax=Sphaerisporangium sp. NPDC088356 TaxID=3154871 RepID=UPI003425C950